MRYAHVSGSGTALIIAALTAGLLVLSGCGDSTAQNPSARSEADAMQNIPQLRQQLADALARGSTLQAETLGKQLGENATPVLDAYYTQGPVQARKNTLDLAAQIRSVGACRIILRALRDPDAEIRESAKFLVTLCSHKELLPEFLAAMAAADSPSFQAQLALKIGAAGTAREVPTLRQYLGKAEDPELIRNLRLALARLGDDDARTELAARLANDDLQTRYQALQDCIYVSDRKLIAQFGRALNDLRDVVVVTIPEEQPQIVARVADVAVMVMATLGVKFPVPAELLTRHSDSTLAEARAVVSRGGL
jgi:hypothetical protein